VENKENLELEYFESETARIHKEYIEGGTNDSHRIKEKRTVSDNSRPLADQSKIPSTSIKVLVDKTNNINNNCYPNQVNGNSFAIKKPSTAMMTDRSQISSSTAFQPNSTSDEFGALASARRSYGGSGA
jgi:hypothetical protein